VATPDLDPERWVDELCRLHAARWADLGEAGVLADDRLARFYRQVIGAFAAQGWARLYALQQGARVLGVYYGFQYRGAAYAYLGGFDPDFAYFSPGTVLVGHAIEQAVREGAREFHFLRGDEAYKYAWGAVDRWNTRRVFRAGAP
jgi:CelD/BcsL family acetyltransferase involved in cellulose biosynthesis